MSNRLMLRNWLGETHGTQFELLRLFVGRFFDSDRVTARGELLRVALGPLALLPIAWLMMWLVYIERYLSLPKPAAGGVRRRRAGGSIVASCRGHGCDRGAHGAAVASPVPDPARLPGAGGDAGGSVIDQAFRKPPFRPDTGSFGAYAAAVTVLAAVAVVAMLLPARHAATADAATSPRCD